MRPDPTTAAAPTSEAPAALPWSRRPGLLLVLLCALVGLAYARTFGGALQFDDRVNLERIAGSFSGTRPPIVDRLRARTLGDYDRRVFTDWTLYQNHRSGGLEPFGYHAVNLAVHLAVVACLFALVRRTLLLPRFGERFRSGAAPLAFAIALVFGVHPLTTQAVTYVIQRGESLMALFYLLALLALVRGAVSPTAGPWIGVAWMAGLLGMASKEVMISAPLTALAYDWVFLRGTPAPPRRRAALHAALWISVLGFGAWSGFLGHALFPAPGVTTDVGLGYAGVTPWRYLLTQCEVVPHYLRLALWPSGLAFDYGWPFAERLRAVWPGALLLAALLAASVALLARRRWSGFCGCAAFLVLAPTSSVVPIADAAFEHRMYLPLAALVALAVGWSVALLARVTGSAAATARAAALGWGAVALALGVATNARNGVYRSELALWSDTVAKRPESARAQSNLSKVRYDAGQGGALESAQRAVELAPTDPGAFLNLGLAREREGDQQGAREAYERALKLDPSLVKARSALGSLLFTHFGDAQGAVQQMQIAQALEPDNALVRYNMGFFQHGMGNLEQALPYYDKALALDPAYLPSSIMKSLCLQGLGRLQDAEATLREGLARAGAGAERGDLVKLHTNLGNVLWAEGRLADAAACYERALAVDPQAESVHLVWQNLGLAREQLGQTGGAVEAFRKALSAAPDYADARAALARLGR